ncbi:MAG: FKBP-type peptidyl-prolyl cis-trans isomerase [gamma proteobacterium symbiont of Bathyaustriella thionipta]|nr:FKBP-type peptidyl-prolyl cis-trans isomerase [gamma proteobacterium symbiont of Bathyaustriella thionipta]MCU7950964.1 FKBP-type peptidyl-prolyl cis-trans isomerase [gamma proteobacterium symbiont of Bathyaustriella thionipta]MCU7953193.1 FKBP-type peptidyl-prolyl cis-trans isomerase [gamma proteobacterium symbiont of Bathyaustriella thionipta]MCU7957456.1 FKBP-type peptidyl-prolyl cis-trans isomerase [gamma proteobacterium symbiont of Bathyaustriella thionipta]MCU7968402.1 FKBP-type peptid
MSNTEYTIKTDADKVSYGIGLQLAQQVKSQSFSGFSLDSLIIGLSDVFNNEPMRFAEDEMQAAFSAINQQVQAAAATAAEGNKAAGKAFLEENAKKEGVITTESGLQYEIITEGTGPKPSQHDTVITHYHGSLIDGSVFDSSVDRGEPAQFPVNGVIQGWIEALQLMPVGSKWRLAIPSDLAYGDQGSAPVIGPGATLIFEIELIEIKG